MGSRREFTGEKALDGGSESELCSVSDRECDRLQSRSLLSPASHLLFHSVLWCFFLFSAAEVTGLNSSPAF